MRIRKISGFAFVVLFAACSVYKPKSPIADKQITMDTVQVTSIPYRAAATRTTDVIHTSLDVKFNWATQQLYGKATITAKPYFHSLSQVELDARGMSIHMVALCNKKDTTKQKLNYEYKNDILKILLDKSYSRTDTFQIFINYTANPEMLSKGGSSAIRDDKGLYFINPDGKDTEKPMQIWTQGETQANSVWFPTVDRPNEKMTNEIFITIENKYSTLSNGILSSSKQNSDGTRTDHWKMNQPHAPYLVMMAIGEFAISKETWNGKEVSYYVEKKYEPYIKDIFGNTVPMLEYFSKLLGTPYPWDKYAQVCVRDYVSGAMENTSATLHGEVVQRTKRELLDRDYEEYISHEAFHQWFGDYVTSESWSNTPLNESFATYGEYLWIEYKYGKEEADNHINDDLGEYLREAKKKQVNMIRYHYAEQEDMFDRHSYSKGGRILHMLRKYVGDDVFFAALKLYLEENKFNTVELANLRLAFEKVSGEDLNWFFNQWFFYPGHPQLEIVSGYDPVAKKAFVTVKQNQKEERTPVYKLPVYVDVYFPGQVKREKIWVMRRNETFYFDAPQQPLLINFDAEKSLLCTKDEKKTVQEWVYQYKNAPLFMDRFEAINALSENLKDSLSFNTLLMALDDKFWNLRDYALEKLMKEKDDRLKRKLMAMAIKDPKALLRADAILVMSTNFVSDDLKNIYLNGLKDSSYNVISQSLQALSRVDKKLALEQAALLEKQNHRTISLAVSSVYANHGTANNLAFFNGRMKDLKGYSKGLFISDYIELLKRCDNAAVSAAIPFMKNIADADNGKYAKHYLKSGVQELVLIYTDKIKTAEKENNPSSLEQLKATKKSLEELLSQL